MYVSDNTLTLHRGNPTAVAQRLSLHYRHTAVHTYVTAVTICHIGGSDSIVTAVYLTVL